MHLRNLEGLSQYDIDPHWHEERRAGISAFLRVRNEEEFIAACLHSIRHFFDEIIVALNYCTDRTPEIVRSISFPNVKICNYPFLLHHNGPGHNSIPENSIHDNSYYYNWTLAKTSFSHACKWDGDMVGLENILDDTLRNNIIASNVAIVTGVNISGSSLSRISSGSPFTTEPRFFRVTEDTFYRQGELVEVFTHKYDSGIYTINSPAFLHFKNVKSVDSATMIWPENWREIPHFQRLWKRREGAEIYRGNYPEALLEYIMNRALGRAASVDALKGQERVMRNLGTLLFKLRNVGMSGPVVEIGSFKGKTTVFLGDICSTLHPDSEVISVDPYSEHGATLALHAHHTEMDEIYTGFQRSVAGLDNHRHLRMPSREAAKELPRDILLSFIDGEHTCDGVMHDFALLFDRTQAGGVIAMDDYMNMAWPGVVRGFARIGKEYRGKVRLILEDGKAAYFQKLPV